MIPSQLKSRIKFIKASPKPKRACIKNFSRKETADISIEEDKHYSEGFDTFFEYEKELAGMKPTGQQYKENVANKDDKKVGFVVMEDKDYFLSNNSNPSPVTMEDADCKKSFEFKQCLHLIEEDRRCKRQAPKGGDYCSSHRNKY